MLCAPGRSVSGMIRLRRRNGEDVNQIARRSVSLFELRTVLSGRTTLLLGLAGATGFFVIWEIGHYLTPEESQRFLPAPQEVLGALITLIVEKDYIADILKSCFRIFASFFAACLIAVPLGIAMGCFMRLRALLNPTISAFRYLPAASFIPLLLVWFGRRTRRSWPCWCWVSSSSLWRSSWTIPRRCSPN